MNQSKVKKIRKQVKQLMGGKLPMVNYETIEHDPRPRNIMDLSMGYYRPIQVIMTNCIRKNVKLTKRNFLSIKRGVAIY